MTDQKKFKQRVRERMAKTGESYVTAQRALEGFNEEQEAERGGFMVNQQALLEALSVLEGFILPAKGGDTMARWIAQWRRVLESENRAPRCWIANGWDPPEALRVQQFAVQEAARAVRRIAGAGGRAQVFDDFRKGLNRPDLSARLPNEAREVDLEVTIFPEGITTLYLAGRCALLGGKTVLRGNTGCDVEWIPEGSAVRIEFECKQRAFARASGNAEEWIRGTVAEAVSQHRRRLAASGGVAAMMPAILLGGFFPARVAVDITGRLPELFETPLQSARRDFGAVGVWRIACEQDAERPSASRGAWIRTDVSAGPMARELKNALTDEQQRGSETDAP